ncbi:hypothetical protein NP493_1528g00027, partial [Ridgeia piscesae]
WIQKTYGEDQQVHIIYEDRPTNDFNYLFRLVEGVPAVTSTEVFNVHFAEGSRELLLFMAQSARDWETFLLHRSKELVPGGCLLVVTLARSTCPGNTGAWCRYRAMTDIWRDMMHEKFISEEEYIATTEHSYWHTAEDLAAPFSDKSSRVTKSGLQQVALGTRTSKCGWRDRWLTTTNRKK